MTSLEIGQSIRELGELIERFHDHPDELERLTARADVRLRQLRRVILEQRIDQTQPEQVAA